jgi:hypothetical protein
MRSSLGLVRGVLMIALLSTAGGPLASAADKAPRKATARPAAATTASKPVAAVDARAAESLMQQKFLLPQALPGEHPLMPALRWARPVLQQIESIDSYSCKLVKRERMGGQMGDYQYLDLKVRHQPFSVYVGFLSPHKGQESIYVEGRNDGLLWAHPPEAQQRLVGTVSLDPTGPRAMKGNRYPITEVGILNLVRRLIEVGEHDTQYGECEVQQFAGAKVNGRVCSVLQFTHPTRRKEFSYHRARIFIDDQLTVPIRYEAYDWPQTAGGEPVLKEEYTYLDMRLNAGLGDLDFDIKNPSYRFSTAQ